MIEPLISIIVPVYNVENYLKVCLDSLINQTYKNLEIILVNDGSKDNSLSICNEYSCKDSRIKVINKKNGGTSSARNAGLAVIKGKYVTFVDSDDYLHHEAILKMYNTIVKTQTDFCLMYSYIVNESYSITKDNSTETETISIYTPSEYIEKMCKHGLSESVCDKLFKSEIIGDMRFELDACNEDFLFMSHLLLKDIKISSIDYSGYYYYQRQGSISHSGVSKALFDSVKNPYRMMLKIEYSNPSYMPFFAMYSLQQLRALLMALPYKDIFTHSSRLREMLQITQYCLKYINRNEFSIRDYGLLEGSCRLPLIVLPIAHTMYKIKFNK